MFRDRAYSRSKAKTPDYSEEDRKVVEMGFAKRRDSPNPNALATGARIAEIAGLTWKCVHLNAEVPQGPFASFHIGRLDKTI